LQTDLDVLVATWHESEGMASEEAAITDERCIVREETATEVPLNNPYHML
jgi:hypothetical protein